MSFRFQVSSVRLALSLSKGNYETLKVSLTDSKDSLQSYLARSNEGSRGKPLGSACRVIDSGSKDAGIVIRNHPTIQREQSA